MFGVNMLQFVFLTEQFYKDYGNLEHIMQKAERPYVRIMLELDGVNYCVPLRSNINHPHVFWTNKEKRCGIDFGNTVAIIDVERYIDTSSKPRIRQDEFNALKGKDYVVKQKLIKYLDDYKKARANMKIPRNRTLVEKSSLQYFEDILDL
ncbi:MAG: type III toxin-antitoxin system TenpIN family toxin [Oscillospiraceae bacterium]